MDTILVQVDSWILALVVGALMIAGWLAGIWRGKRLSPADRANVDSTFSGASMALLGLLLGFTFSMSLTKHELRRQMVIADANAIGDFATCAAFVKEPARATLRTQVRDYVQHRLDTRKGTEDPGTQEKMLDEIRKMHAAMTDTVGDAIQLGSPVVIPLVNKLNDVTSSHAARVAAIRDRLPTAIVMLLAVAAVITMVLIGIQQGADGHRQHVSTWAFVVLVSMVIWVILDLNQPRRGMITVSQEPMEMLLKEL